MSMYLAIHEAPCVGVAPEDYEIMPCDLDPFGECPKPEYARDCAKCHGWTESEADEAFHDSLADS